MPDRQSLTTSRLDDRRFADLMAPFAPFEDSPRLAVAVSGGPDSLALTHLADTWARRNEGSVVALIVDHGLRPESEEEAHRVAGWMTDAGIAREILRPAGSAPDRNIQDWARAARYALLTKTCRDRGILHLLTAHHRDDQAETLLIRLGRGSGLDGLAAMAPIVDMPDCRLLRPLLPVAKADLIDWLSFRELEWIDDPGNRSPAFARGAWREQRDLLSNLGLTIDRLAETASRLAADRAALEETVGKWLAGHAMVDRTGYVSVDRGAFVVLAPALGRRILAALLGTVGGSVYAPRRERLSRLLAAIGGADSGGATLGGCHVTWNGAWLVVVRELAAVDHVVDLSETTEGLWDSRFLFRISPAASPAVAGLTLRRLGADGWRQIGPDTDDKRALTIPKAARLALPAIFRSETVIAAPLLGYGPDRHGTDILDEVEMVFRPARALAPTSFAIADWPESPM